jgi:hypothetical protein
MFGGTATPPLRNQHDHESGVPCAASGPPTERHYIHKRTAPGGVEFDGPMAASKFEVVK